MTRVLYRFLLSLHPPAFRRRFRDEMLSIFEESIPSQTASAALLDAVASLFRQWLLRTDYWKIALAVGVALVQFCPLALSARSRHIWIQNRNPLTPHMQLLILSTLALLCGLVILILSLSLGIMRSRNQRSRPALRRNSGPLSTTRA